jgi:hypothetical protein
MFVAVDGCGSILVWLSLVINGGISKKGSYTMRYSKNQQIDKYVRILIRHYGWQFHVEHGHGKLVTSAGQCLTVPCTPSDWRAFYNFRRDARRLEAQGYLSVSGR